MCSLTEDILTHKKYAVKKIARAFDSKVDARRVFREVKLLRHLKHENIIKIEQVLPSPRGDLNDLYLVFELMDTDLHQIIHSKQTLSEEHCRYFLYQVRPRHLLSLPAQTMESKNSLNCRCCGGSNMYTQPMSFTEI